MKISSYQLWEKITTCLFIGFIALGLINDGYNDTVFLLVVLCLISQIIYIILRSRQDTLYNVLAVITRFKVIRQKTVDYCLIIILFSYLVWMLYYTP